MFLRTAALATGLLLVFTGIANSQRGRHLSGVRTLSLSISSGTKSVSGSPVPDSSACWTSFNGNNPQMAWEDSAHVLEYAWHGVIAVVATSDSALTLKVASIPREPVYVYARCSW